MKILKFTLLLCAPLLVQNVNAATLSVPSEYPTIQSAIDASQDGDTVEIEPGIYEEQVRIDNAKISLVGLGLSNRDVRIVHRENYFDGNFNESITFRATVDIEIFNLSIENRFNEPAARARGERSHTLAARFDGNAWAEDLVVVGYSDILRVDGDLYCHSCKLVGTNDMVYGTGSAHFNRSVIRSIGFGRIFAHGPLGGNTESYNLTNSKIIGSAEGYVLGRPWSAHSNVRIIGTYIDGNVRDFGYDNFNRPERESSAIFFECDNRGPGADLSGRVSWAKNC